ENSRKSISHCRKIYSTRARRADVGRSDRGGELLSARRALLPRDRRGAGAVPAEQSPLPPSGERTARHARRWLRGRRRRWAAVDERCPRLALRHPRAATLYPARRATFPAAPTAPAAPTTPAAGQHAARWRRRPLAVLHHRRATAPVSSTSPPRPERPRQPASPPVPRGAADAAAIAARGRTCRVAVTAETDLLRATTDRVAHARD